MTTDQPAVVREDAYPVIRADRVAAAPYMGFAFDRVMAGHCDSSGLVQQFARHRIAHSARPDVGEVAILVAHVTALADSLEAELRDRYGYIPDLPMHRDTHRRFERDMQEVHAARAALSAAMGEVGLG